MSARDRDHTAGSSRGGEGSGMEVGSEAAAMWSRAMSAESALEHERTIKAALLEALSAILDGVGGEGDDPDVPVMLPLTAGEIIAARSAIAAATGEAP